MKSSPVLQTDLPLPLYGRGKVRDTYDLGDQLLIVATDRISAFDVVLPTGIPHKGQVLTAFSAFWFEITRRIVPNHMITHQPRQFPFDWRSWSKQHQDQIWGRSMLVRKAERIDIECVVRGYVAGSGWDEYQKSGTLAGIPMPHDLQESGQMLSPVFSPAIKANTGHDENITFEEMASRVGPELAEQLRDASLRLYAHAAEFARNKGVIIADTKFEFGMIDGELTVIDEMLTPDSSRFWEVEKYRFGEPQVSLDKQFVRDWLKHEGWNREPPGPVLPDEIVKKTTEKYLEAYSRLTRRDLLTELYPQQR